MDASAATATTISGGRLLAGELVRHGCRMAFCVPGESYLALLDGLYEHRDSIRLITCRHEAAAAHAAEAYGKLTGTPGVCLVTRGPGATHAAVGVHTARQDSTPMLLLVGQVAREHTGREAFQEIDCAAVFGTLAKAVIDVRDAERIPEHVASAFALAISGRPGPVVLSLPEDVLDGPALAPVESDAPRAGASSEPAPAADQLATLRSMLDGASRPFVLVGGGPWDRTACERLARWAEACRLPVGASFRRQDTLDNEHPSYAGDVGLGLNPRLRERLQAADLLVALGPRLTEIETQGYALPPAPAPHQPLVHVHPDPSELGRVYQPSLAIATSVRTAVAAFEAEVRVDGGRWEAWRRDARADFEAWSAPSAAQRPSVGPDLAAAMAALRALLPDDAIVCNGAGNFSQWLHRFFRYRGPGTQLAPQSGAMGYGLPAALAAAALHGDRAVVAVEGDGSFQMCAQELATLVQERLPVLVLVVNNRRYGTIRMHQERRFPGRTIATDLGGPDFVALARAHGLRAARAESMEAFEAEAATALAARMPALIELPTDPDLLSPAMRIAPVGSAEA